MAESNLKLIGAVGVKVRPDANGFRGETQRALNKELAGLSQNVSVGADVKMDTRKAENDLKALKRQMNNLSQGVRIDLQTKGLSDLKKYNDALEEYKENTEAAAKAADKYFGANKGHAERIRADEEMLASRRKLIDASKELATSWNDLNVKPMDLKIVNAADIDAQFEKVHRNFQAMKDEADELADHIDSLDPSMEIDLAGTELAAAQLMYASRPRTVPFLVTVNKKSLAIAEGMLKSLSGLNVIQSAGRHLEDLLVNFDKVTIKGTLMAAVIGNIANSLTWLGTSMFSVGGGMAKVVGLLAMAPTALSALASVVTINVAAWKNFKGAIDGDAKALEALPPAARAAAKALQGTWTQIQKPVQTNFWEGMGTAIQDAVEHTLPALRDGLSETSTHIGRFTAGVLNSFTKMSQTGQFTEMFEGVAEFFDNLAGAAEPAFDAFNTLGVRGSNYMGQLGQSITDAAIRFDDWITAADEAGKINVWIENGVKSFQDMWSVLGSTVDMFQALTRAANDAGATGLDGLARRMEELADIMDAEPFQSRMSNIFEGARQGATNLNVGIKDLGRTFGESSEAVAYMLELLGTIGGMTLSGVADALNQPNFQGGIIEGLQGMRELLDDMGPGFNSLAGIIGNFARIAGSVLSTVGEPLSNILGVFEDITDIVGDELAAAVPALTGTLNTLVNILAGPLEAGAHVLEGILSIFNSLPGGIQSAVVALGAMIAMRGSMSAMFSNMGNSAKTAFSGLMGYTKQADGSMKNMRGQTVSMAAALGSLGSAGNKSFPFLRAAWQEQTRMVTSGNEAVRKYAMSVSNVGVGNAAIGRLSAAFTGLQQAGQRLNLQPSVSSVRNLGTAALGAAGHIGMAAGAGLRGAASGLMGVMGGPWGLALMAGVVAISSFANANAKAKGRVDELKQSLDQQTGAVTEATKKTAISQLTRDYDGFSGVMYKLFGTAPDAQEWSDTIAETGVSLGEAADMAVKGGPAYDAYMAKLEDMTTGTGSASSHLIDFKDRMQEVHDNAQAQKEAVRIYAEALGETGPAAQKMADAMAVIRDNSKSAAEKLDSVRYALDDLAQNGELSAREAEVAAAKATNSALETARGVKDIIAQSQIPINEVPGMINKLHPAFTQLHDGLKQTADGILISATAAYDAAKAEGKVGAEATEEALKIIGGNEEALAAFAKEAGLLPEQLQGDWDLFFGKDWEVLASISGTNDQFKAAAEEAKKMGVELDEEEFMAWILAKNDPAATTIEEAQEWMRAWDRRTAVATLDADDERASTKLADAYTNAKDFDDAIFLAYCDLDTAEFDAKREQIYVNLANLARENPRILVDLDPQIFHDRKAEVLAEIEELEQKEATPEVKARIEELQSQLNVANLLLAEIAARETVTSLTGEKEGFDAVMAAARAEGAVFDTSTFTSWLDANKEQFEGKKYSADELGKMFAESVFQSKLDADPAGFNSKKAGADQSGAAFQLTTFTSNLDANKSPFEGTRWAAKALGDEFGRAWFNTNLGANNAAGDGVSVATAWVNENWVGKTFTATLRTAQETTAANGLFAPAGFYADGGINHMIQKFANGGFSGSMVKQFAGGGMENHVAQISRGQTPYRVWSEPETGGEAYIPLASAKRHRSTQILQQVATHFGMNLVPKTDDVSVYANGGTNGLINSDRTGAGVAVNIGSYVTNKSDTPDDVARALMRRIKAQGAYSPLEAF